MPITYTYDTGQISHFALKKVEGSCHRDENHTVLIGVFCKHCPHYNGMHDRYVICDYHDKDDEGASKARDEIYDTITRNALCALDG